MRITRHLIILLKMLLLRTLMIIICLAMLGCVVHDTEYLQGYRRGWQRT